MTNNNNPVSVTYSDAELHNLVEEYITQQKEEFTLKGACSYVFYWAVEDSKIAEGNNIIENYELQASDQERVNRILKAIVADGRIKSNSSEIFIKQ